MTTLAISPITDADVAHVIALWQRCGLTRPWNDPAADIALARRGANADDPGRPCGRRDRRERAGRPRRPSRLGLLRRRSIRITQGKDFGRAIMAAAEDWLRAQGVEKVMLMVRPDNTKVRAFYDRLGYDDAGARRSTRSGSMAGR